MFEFLYFTPDFLVFDVNYSIFTIKYRPRIEYAGFPEFSATRGFVDVCGYRKYGLALFNELPNGG